MKSFLEELKEYVAIPSVSAQPKHAKDCLKAAHWMAAKLKSLGFASKLVSTGGHPLVMATRKKISAAPHIVVYGHYDVQPAEPFNLWKTPPFKLTVKGRKILGRGAADNKGPTLALLWGLAEALKKNPNVNITCLIEGEEEVGSRNLPKVLKKLKKEIGYVDVVALSDTASPSADKLSITAGTRGLLALEVKITGLARDLHSGNGGPVPNAIRELARVLATIHDAQGWVTIPGFYKGIIPPSRMELKSLNAQITPAEFAREIGAKGYYPLNGKNPFEINRFFPSFEINGITGGYQGEGDKTIIPAVASVKITCRVAAGQDPKALKKAVISELGRRIDKKLFSFSIDAHRDASAAYAIPLGKGAKATANFKRALSYLDAANRAVLGEAPAYLREGGTIGILPDLKKVLGADSLMLGLFTDGSLLHSPNENADMKMLENGSKVWQKFFESF